MNKQQKRLKKRIRFSLIFIIVFVALFTFFAVGHVFAQAETGTGAREVTQAQADIAKWGLIAAAVAFGFGAVSAGLAISNVGSAAMGAMGEKPELGTQALIFIALGEGLVVFGFITALMILGKF